MTSRASILLLAGLLSCRDVGAPEHPTQPPGVPVVTAVGMTAVRVEWMPVDAPDVIGYRVERRINLEGSFTTAVENVSQGPGPLVFFDVGLTPDTYYGYRVLTLPRLGSPSPPSLVRGAKTPPPPGIAVRTASSLETSAAQDPDGYVVTIVHDGKRLSAPVAPTGSRIFTPLEPGAYSVELAGVQSFCALDGSAMRASTVTDVGVRTVDTVSYLVRCRDPNLGRLTALVHVNGDTLGSYSLELTGTLDDVSLPEAERILFRSVSVAGVALGQTPFAMLPPGTYELALVNISPHCTRDGASSLTSEIGPLADDTLQFTITCRRRGTDDGGEDRPLVWVNEWQPGAAASGQRVALAVRLDLSADDTLRLGAAQATIGYSAAILRFDSAQAGDLRDQFSSNGQTTGSIAFAGISLTGRTGVVSIARLHFTVIGGAGASFQTRTTELSLADAEDAAEIPATLARIMEGTFTVGSAAANQPPQAEANGPYNSVTGMPVAFSAAGSSDPDGTIVSHVWAFGDGATASGSTVTHVYAAAGTYTATLTVTDNLGATAAAPATVTVSPPPVTSAPLEWRGDFGAVNPADSVVSFTITLDLSADLPATPGVEELDTWRVDSLRWNPAVLRYHAFIFGPGGSGSVNPTDAMTKGTLVFNGRQPATNNRGVITIATVKFKVIGAPGSVTTTQTAVGLLVGTPATGSFQYRPHTSVREDTLTPP